MATYGLDGGGFRFSYNKEHSSRLVKTAKVGAKKWSHYMTTMSVPTTLYSRDCELVGGAEQ